MTLYKIDEDTQIDEFGVDHSKFSLRDELEYNFMRAKEKEMKPRFMPDDYWDNMLAKKRADALSKQQLF